MSKDLFEKPQIVIEAAEAKKGWHWAVEILVFIAVFFVSQVAMIFTMMPVELVMLFTNADYTKAIAAGDMQGAINASLQVAGSNGYQVCMLAADIVLILLVCLFCKLLQKRKMFTLGFGKKGMVKEYLIGGLAGFAVFSVAVLGSVVTGGLKIEGFSADFSIGWFLLFLCGFMIQGMAEEVLCRGYFLVSVARRYPVYLAVLLNALLFGALHLLNSGISLLAFINLVLFGIFASVYFVRRGSIWGIGAFHTVWNLVQGNFYGIKVSGMNMGQSLLVSTSLEGKELLSGGDFGLEGSIIVTLVLCAGIAVLYFWKKQPLENS